MLKTMLVRIKRNQERHDFAANIQLPICLKRSTYSIVYKVINYEVLTKLCEQMIKSTALIIYGTTRAWRVENLITHGITDKGPYLYITVTD